MTAEWSSSERCEEWASAPNNEEVCTEAHEDYEEEKPQPKAGRVIRRKACVGAPVAAKAKVNSSTELPEVARLSLPKSLALPDRLVGTRFVAS